MEPLFEVETEYTLESYTEYVKTVQKSRVLKLFLFIVAFLLLFNIIWLTLLNTVFTVYFSIIMIPLFAFEIKLIIKWNARKSWDSNRNMHGMVSHYILYEDHIEQKNSLGNSSIKYDQLYCILESKNAFYLMIANNQGYIISKDACSNELLQFLSELKNQHPVPKKI